MATIYSIYKAQSTTTGKVYIGFTQDLVQRKATHKYDSKHSCIKFYQAARKYGWDDFNWEIIYQSWDYNHCLSVMEPFFIYEYNSIIDGYNISEGGNRGPKLYGAKNGMFGRTHSYEVRQKLAETAGKARGKTYEERYGAEKAAQLKMLRSQTFKGANHRGTNNARYDPGSYQFYNTRTRASFFGTRFDFIALHEVPAGDLSGVISGRLKHTRGWIVVQCFNPILNLR